MGERRTSLPERDRAGRARALDAPLVVLLVTVAAYGIFSAARLIQFDGNPASFAVAGDAFSNAEAAPPSLPILEGSAGYDGQFFYRLALHPWTTAPTYAGIRMDAPAWRQQRIFYPLLVYLLSWGDPEAAAVMMVVVNLAALAALGWLAGAWARACGEHALFGLLISLYPGYLLSFYRDLAEIVTAALLLGGLWMMHRRRPWAASGLLTLAVLTRETALLAAGAAGLVVLLERIRSGPGPERRWVAFVAPLFAWIGWQLVLLERWGGPLPVRAGSHTMGAPLAGVAGFLARCAARDGCPVLFPGEAALLLGVLILGGSQLRRSSAALHIKLGWCFYATMGVFFSSSIWIEDFGFMRAHAEAYLLAALVILASDLPAKSWLVLAGAALWTVTAMARFSLP